MENENKHVEDPQNYLANVHAANTSAEGETEKQPENNEEKNETLDKNPEEKQVEQVNEVAEEVDHASVEKNHLAEVHSESPASEEKAEDISSTISEDEKKNEE